MTSTAEPPPGGHVVPITQDAEGCWRIGGTTYGSRLEALAHLIRARTATAEAMRGHR